MISRQQLAVLGREYRCAQGKVDHAAIILEDVCVLSGRAGEEFIRDSYRLIRDATALHAEITKVLHKLGEVTPDDWP